MMEEKQLDFNRPLLSVRRSSPTNQVQNKRKPRDSIPNIPAYKSEFRSGPLRIPGSVPFNWEQTPGRPKTGTETKSLMQPVITPKLPPGRLHSEFQCDNPNFVCQFANHNVNGISMEVIQEKENSSTEDSDDEKGFVDALDTLSISHLDGQDLKPLSTDAQSPDFMMGRFLPAAQALASQTPPQQHRKKRDVVSKANHLPFYQTSPRNLSHIDYHQDKRSEDDGECDHAPTGLCGLLPPFCFKSSFCLLNPVTGMRMQAQKALSVRTCHTKSSRGQTKHEHARGEHKLTGLHQSTDGQRHHCQNQVYGSLLEGTSQIVDESLVVFEGIPSEVPNIGQLSANEENRWESSPVVEKTLYIDTLHKATISPTTTSRSPNTNRNHSVKSAAIEDLKLINNFHKPQPKTADSILRSSCAQLKGQKDFISDLNRIQFPRIVAERESGSKKVTFSCENHVLDQSSSVETGSCHGDYLQLPVPPALPKAPSESWLKRTLPTISASSLDIGNRTRFQSPPMDSDSKWENIVKSSTLHQ